MNQKSWRNVVGDGGQIQCVVSKYDITLGKSKINVAPYEGVT